MKRIMLILRIKLVLSFLFLFFIYQSSPAQTSRITHFEPLQNTIQNNGEQCGIRYMEEKQEKELGILGSREYFEAWMEDQVALRKARPELRTAATEPRAIPVVVHIIHNGTGIGQGANIPLGQIEAQIEILNEDFRRLNGDASNTPDEFLPVAADAMVQFVLAKQDPRGLPTNGINRVQGNQSTYEPSDSETLGQLAYWPGEDYLNIWVVPLENPYIGYASFPTSDLPGLNFSPNSRETDGVTIDYRYFGSGGNAVSASRGRTTTHEVGHFFGLRHIWGDGGCDVDDFVEDTPTQNQSNNSCRTTPRTSCDTRDMVENFMDYTPDQCMNLFTQGQVERFDVILAESPRRASLVNGRATQTPEIFANDLALEQILVPQDFICSPDVTPEIVVFNAGENELNSVTLEIFLDGQPLEEKTFSVNLGLGELDTLTFSPISLAPINNNFEVQILEINGEQDIHEDNNSLSSAPFIQPTISAPYEYEPSDFEEIWNLKNDDGGITWTTTETILGGSQQQLISINNFNNENQGSRDFFISPQINLSNTPNAQLVFDMAHAQYPGEDFNDRLVVAVSTDCGNTFNILDAPYDKQGAELSTVTSSTNEFTPNTASQFRTEVVNLNQYAGMDNIRIAFISINGFGNNIFLKDISLRATEELTYNLRLDSLVSPSPITDGSQNNERLSLTNTGNLTISSFLLDRKVNNRETETLISTGEFIAPGESVIIALENALEDGTNALEYRVYAPNFDQNGEKGNTLNRFIVQDDESLTIPWRQDFDHSLSLDPWHSINPENGQTSWELIAKNNGDIGDNLANLRNQMTGNSYWIGSPLMDWSGISRASIFFDLAASGVDEDTQLKIMLSQDGGVSFNQEVAVYQGADLNTITGGVPIDPNVPESFRREFVDLSEFADGESEKVRLAFVVEQGSQGNNPVYLDNIEFFLGNNPDPVYPGSGNAILYPNPATDLFHIAFNLENFEDVQIQIISLMGEVVHDAVYSNTLNQTYSFHTELFSKGMFIIKINSETITSTRRLVIE